MPSHFHRPHHVPGNNSCRKGEESMGPFEYTSTHPSNPILIDLLQLIWTLVYTSRIG
jgi:hypothetical protein